MPPKGAYRAGDQWVLWTGQTVNAAPRRGRSSTPGATGDPLGGARLLFDRSLSMPVPQSPDEIPITYNINTPRTVSRVRSQDETPPVGLPQVYSPAASMAGAHQGTELSMIPYRRGALPEAIPKPQTRPKRVPPSTMTRVFRFLQNPLKPFAKCACCASLALVITASAVFLSVASESMTSSLERTVHTIADVTSATGIVAMSGANVSMALSEVAVASVKGASSAISEAWAGVDLIDMTLSAKAAQFFFHVSLHPEEATRDAAGGLAATLPPENYGSLIKALELVGPLTPRLAVTNSTASYGREFDFFLYEVAYFAPGYVGAKFLYSHVRYRAQWSNFAWEPFFNVSAEWAAITAALHKLVRDRSQCPWVFDPLAPPLQLQEAGADLTWWHWFLGQVEVVRRR